MALKELLTDLSKFKYTNYENVGANNSQIKGRHGGFKGSGQPPHPEEHSKFDDKVGKFRKPQYAGVTSGNEIPFPGNYDPNVGGIHGGIAGPTPAQPPHSDRHSLHDNGVGHGIYPSDHPQSFNVRGYTITGNKRFYIGWQGDIMNHPLSDYGIGAFDSIAGVFDHTQTRDKLRKVYSNYPEITFGADIDGGINGLNGSIHIGNQDLPEVVGGGLSYYGNLNSITPRGSIYRAGDGTYRVPQSGHTTIPPGVTTQYPSNIPTFDGTQITLNIPQIVLTGPFGDEDYQSILNTVPRIPNAHGSDFMTTPIGDSVLPSNTVTHIVDMITLSGPTSQNYHRTLNTTPIATGAHGSDFMTTPLANYVSDFHPTYSTTSHISGFNRDNMYIPGIDEPSTPVFNQFTRSDTPLIRIDRYSDNFDMNNSQFFEFPDTRPYDLIFKGVTPWAPMWVSDPVTGAKSNIDMTLDSTQPYIVRQIGDRWGLFEGDEEDGGSHLGKAIEWANTLSGQFFRAPIDVMVDRSVADIGRIAKFLTSTKGTVFLAKQAILQLFSPTIETKFYNPLSLGSIVPMVHINRHLGGKRYTDVVPSDSAVDALASFIPGAEIGPVGVAGADILNAAFDKAGIDIPSFGRIEMQSPLASVNGIKFPLEKRMLFVNPNRYIWPAFPVPIGGVSGGSEAAIRDASKIERSQNTVLVRAQEQSGGGIKDLYLAHSFNKYSNENVYLNKDGILFYPEEEKPFGSLASLPISVSQIMDAASNWGKSLFGGKKKQKNPSWKPDNARGQIVTEGLAAPHGSMTYVASPLYESITIETPKHKKQKDSDVLIPRSDIGRLGPGIFNPLETGYIDDIFVMHDEPEDPYGPWATRKIQSSKVVQLGALKGKQMGLSGSPNAQYWKMWSRADEATKPGSIYIGEKKLIKDANLGFENPIMITDVFVGDAYSDSNKYWSVHGTPTKPTHVAKTSLKALGHASAPSAKQQIIFIHKGRGSTLSVADTPNSISTKFDHESDGTESKVFTISSHDGKNIYKKGTTLYLSAHIGGGVTGRPPSKLAEAQAGVSIGKLVGDPVFSSKVTTYTTGPISITTPFPSTGIPGHDGTNIYKKGIVYTGDTADKGIMAPQYYTATAGGYGKLTQRGAASGATKPTITFATQILNKSLPFSGNIKSDGFTSDLYDSSKPYSMGPSFTISQDKEPPKTSPLKKTRLQTDQGIDPVTGEKTTTPGEPVVQMATAHWKGQKGFGTRLLTAGKSTLTFEVEGKEELKSLKLFDFPLLNKLGKGANVGTEGQALGFIDISGASRSDKLAGNLYGYPELGRSGIIKWPSVEKTISIINSSVPVMCHNHDDIVGAGGVIMGTAFDGGKCVLAAGQDKFLTEKVSILVESGQKTYSERLKMPSVVSGEFPWDPKIGFSRFGMHKAETKSGGVMVDSQSPIAAKQIAYKHPPGAGVKESSGVVTAEGKLLTDRFEVASDGIFDESQRIESKTTGVGGALDRYRTLAYGDIPRGENPDNRYETILKSASEIKTVSTDISKFLSHPGEGIRNKAKSKVDAQGNPGKVTTRIEIRSTGGYAADGSDLETEKITISDIKLTNDPNLGLIKKSDEDKYMTSLIDKVNMHPYGDEDNNDDFIKFKFYDLVNKKYIIFRASLSGISETIAPEWSSERYIGRPDSVHVYQGVERSMSFEFMVVPTSKQELPVLWEKLNYLVGLTYPTWKKIGFGNRMEGPFMNLTIGDMYVNTPGFLSSLSITVDDNSPWELDEGFQLPHAISVSCEFTHIGKYPLASQGKHYDLGWLRKYDNTTEWTDGDSHLDERPTLGPTADIPNALFKTPALQ